jgi:hypothetical protein
MLRSRAIASCATGIFMAQSMHSLFGELVNVLSLGNCETHRRSSAIQGPITFGDPIDTC